MRTVFIVPASTLNILIEGYYLYKKHENYSVTSKSFCHRIKKREQGSLTQRQITEKMQSTRSLVFLENGKNMPSLQTFFAVAEALEIDPLELLRCVVARRYYFEQKSE